MKLHCLSRSYAVPLAYQAQRESCTVTAHLPVEGLGDGIVTKTPNVKPAGKPDAILVDGAGWGKVVNELVNDGHRVLFGGAWAELMNLKPDYNRKALAKSGVAATDTNTLPYQLLVGGWYEHGEQPPYFAAVLRDRLLAGDVGAPQGIVSAEVMPLEHDADVVQEWLVPVSESLGDVPYRGLLSVGLTQTADGLAATHIVAGIHPLVIEALSEMTHGGLPALIGQDVREDDSDCTVALSLTLPPWPYGIAQSESPVPIQVDGGQAKHFWPLDTRKGDDGLMYAGTLGIVGSVTARGRPGTDEREATWFRQAGFRARTMASRIPVPMLQYRTDIGYHSDRALAPLALLQPAR